MLTLTQVEKRYCDGSCTRIAVTVDNLSLAAGEQVALVGPSGSGKTTLLHLISGLLTPTAGTITFDNAVISGMPEAWRDTWRGKTVGYVFQKFNLLPSLDILSNLLVPMSFVDAIPKNRQQEWAIHLLDRVRLADKLNRYPNQLSMGEQQRVAVVRAVINKPSLLLADEPTASLDQENSLVVLELLQQLAREYNSILLAATHDKQVVNLFDRTYVLGHPVVGGNQIAAGNSLA